MSDELAEAQAELGAARKAQALAEAPESAPASEAAMQRIVQSSPLLERYGAMIDRESALEMLQSTIREIVRGVFGNRRR